MCLLQLAAQTIRLLVKQVPHLLHIGEIAVLVLSEVYLEKTLIRCLIVPIRSNLRIDSLD